MDEGHIIRIAILPMGLVNAHLIYTSQGCILVDAGLPNSEKRILQVLQQHHLTFSDIKLIVITHAHVDHAGNAARLRTLTGAKIVAHIADAPYYRRERTMTFCPTGWFGKLFLRTGLMFEPYTAFEADIWLNQDQTLDLQPFGIQGTVRPCAGHTAGSLLVELANKQVLVGDLVASGVLLGGIMCNHCPKQPPFEEDTATVNHTLKNLVRAGYQQFYMGHGGPLSVQAIIRHTQFLDKQL